MVIDAELIRGTGDAWDHKSEEDHSQRNSNMPRLSSTARVIDQKPPLLEHTPIVRHQNRECPALTRTTFRRAARQVQEARCMKFDIRKKNMPVFTLVPGHATAETGGKQRPRTPIPYTDLIRKVKGAAWIFLSALPYHCGIKIVSRIVKRALRYYHLPRTSGAR